MPLELDTHPHWETSSKQMPLALVNPSNSRWIDMKRRIVVKMLLESAARIIVSNGDLPPSSTEVLI